MQDAELHGRVDSIIFSSNDGAFSVLRIKNDNSPFLHTATINAHLPLVGQEVIMTGEWVIHPRFGKQFKASTICAKAPSNIEGIERFLASRVIEGIGPSLAKRIVNKFGNETLHIIGNNPEKLEIVAGIGKKTAIKIHESYKAQSELHEIMLWLEERGISGVYAARIFKQYGVFSIKVLETNPYRLAVDVEGIGFRVADAIAKANGVDNNNAERIGAGIGYVIGQISLNGHTCVPEGLLIDKSAKILNVSRIEVADCIKKEIKKQRLVAVDEYGDRLLYLPYLYNAEKNTADKLLSLQKWANIIKVSNAEERLKEWEQISNTELATEQRKAVLATIDAGILVITGGPGTGKTTTIRCIINILEINGYTVLLGAPTGRAAKRLAESTDRKAVTIHRMLEAQGISEEGRHMFLRDENDRLEADIIILDEVSMVDIVLMENFLAAVPKGAHVILVGDVDQLPAVGPGSVLKDILKSGIIPCVRLNEIFRQDSMSMIARNAHSINAGRMPAFTNEEFKFIESEGEVAQNYILELCKRILPDEGYNPLFDIQVLSPMHREVCGVDALNRKLQQVLNPNNKGKREINVGMNIYREGDKIMQTRNDYIKGVFNGDIGIITDIGVEVVKIEFVDGVKLDYAVNELGNIKLAYAMSVHKSQGCEYPVIILPLVKSHSIMLQRNLLYTAVTRARQKVILVGNRSALFTAISNNKTQRRYTLLTERLIRYHN